MRGTIALLLAGLVAAAPAFGQSSGDKSLGLVTEAPAEGPFVKTDRGYMVPYEAQLPGTCTITYTMIPIPGGKHRVERDGVEFEVEIAPFWMGKTEVTWAEYWEYMKLYLHFRKFERRELRVVTDENQVDAVSAPTELYEPKMVYDFGDQPNHPALSMRQYAAKQYTKWLSLQVERFYRLPSEAEWEYACLAGSAGPFSFAADAAELDHHAWFARNSNDRAGVVGSKRPNAFGLYDMHGNVAEWVLDGQNSRAPVPKSGSTISAEAAIVWPEEIFNRFAKGGSFLSEPDACTVQSRLPSSPDWLSNDAEYPLSLHWNCDGDEGFSVGFRLLRPLKVPAREEQEKMWSPDLPELKKEVDLKRESGRFTHGLVDPELPNAIKKLPPGW